MSTKPRVSVFLDAGNSNGDRAVSICEWSSPFDQHSVEMTLNEAGAVHDEIGTILARKALTLDAVVTFLNEADRETMLAISRGLNPRLVFGEK